MHELETKVQKICNLKDQLVSAACAEFDCGIANVDTNEAGEVVDMIKDLAEAEEKIVKAFYYKTLIKAMKEAEEDAEDGGAVPWYLSMLNPELMSGRAGYDNWRYASGRFAPKGHGHRSGFVPSTDGHMMPQYVDDRMRPEHWMDNQRMGYGSPDGMSSSSRTGYGDSYGRYRDAIRHYTESHSQKDRDEADIRAREHVTEAMDTFRDIWKDADPELRKKMKAELTTLLGGMTT